MTTLEKVFKGARTPAGRKVMKLVPYAPPRLIFTALPYVFNPGTGGPASGLMEIIITGKRGGTWHLYLGPDDIKVVPGKAPTAPRSRLTMDAGTWIDIAMGRITGTEAFARGRIDVQGDLALTLKLDACFA